MIRSILADTVNDDILSLESMLSEDFPDIHICGKAVTRRWPIIFDCNQQYKVNIHPVRWWRGRMEYWKNGKMEGWNRESLWDGKIVTFKDPNGIQFQYSNIPTFHCSNHHKRWISNLN